MRSFLSYTLLALTAAVAVFALCGGFACLAYALGAGQNGGAGPSAVFGWLGGAAGMVFMGALGCGGLLILAERAESGRKRG